MGSSNFDEAVTAAVGEGSGAVLLYMANGKWIASAVAGASISNSVEDGKSTVALRGELAASGPPSKAPSHALYSLFKERS